MYVSRPRLKDFKTQNSYLASKLEPLLSACNCFCLCFCRICSAPLGLDPQKQQPQAPRAPHGQQAVGLQPTEIVLTQVVVYSKKE